MSEMTARESGERYIESMKRAASRCRELGVLVNNPQWSMIAASLDGLRKKGEAIIVSKALSNAQVDVGIAQHKKRLGLKNGHG